MTVDSALGTLVTLYIIYLFKTDYNLGTIISLFYAITIFFNTLFDRRCKYKYFASILVTTDLFMVSSAIIFIYFPSKTTIIFYNFCFISEILAFCNIS